MGARKGRGEEPSLSRQRISHGLKKGLVSKILVNGICQQTSLLRQEALLQFRGKKLLDERNAGILQFPLHFQSFHSLIQKDTSELPSSIRFVLLYLTK